MLKRIDYGEGRGEIACLLGLSCSTVTTIVKELRVKIMGHVKSAVHCNR
jgi:hypothetical protein